VARVALFARWDNMARAKIRYPQSRELVAQGPSKSGPVNFTFAPGEQGVAQVGVRIDYSRTSVPDLTYYADYCAVQKVRHGVICHFGKLDSSEERLRTKIEISFPEHLFRLQLWASSEGLRGTLAAIYGTDDDTPERADPDKIQTFAANNVFMAVQQDEALLDFYYLSPRETWLAYQKSVVETHLHAVVRISCGAWLLYQFLRKCSQFAPADEKELIRHG
jgi:hypothetical protein